MASVYVGISGSEEIFKRNSGKVQWNMFILIFFPFGILDVM